MCYVHLGQLRCLLSPDARFPRRIVSVKPAHILCGITESTCPRGRRGYRNSRFRCGTTHLCSRQHSHERRCAGKGRHKEGARRLTLAVTLPRARVARRAALATSADEVVGAVIVRTARGACITTVSMTPSHLPSPSHTRPKSQAQADENNDEEHAPLQWPFHEQSSPPGGFAGGLPPPPLPMRWMSVSPRPAMLRSKSS